jgi:hypothetical protein
LYPGDAARFGKLGLVAEVNPYHISDDMRWMEERIGTERSRGAYAFRTLKKAGAVLVFGSDSPGTNAARYFLNPVYGLYAATSRQTLTGEPRGGWFPDERLTIEEAIEAATKNPAWASFEEQIKGTITAGKLADLGVRHESRRGGTHRTGAIAEGARVVHDRRRQGRIRTALAGRATAHTGRHRAGILTPGLLEQPVCRGVERGEAALLRIEPAPRGIAQSRGPALRRKRVDRAGDVAMAKQSEYVAGADPDLSATFSHRRTSHQWMSLQSRRPRRIAGFHWAYRSRPGFSP